MKAVKIRVVKEIVIIVRRIVMETKERPVSKFTSRLSYTFGAFGNDVFYAALSSYLIMFITSHLFNTGDKATNNRKIMMIKVT